MKMSASDKTAGSRARQRAMTLTEVMAALVILSIVMLGTAGFFTHACGQIAAARSERLAVEVATAKLDELMAADYTEVADRTETDVPFGLWTGDITTDVTERTEGSARYKEVGVTIAWETTNRSLDVTLNSVIGKK